jgi:hypothetical protein
MKKNVLALSITAALVGIGFAGGAQAIGLANFTTDPIPPGAAVNLKSTVDGIGHFLLVPYYTVQAGNATMINVVNTDTTNGKAVKVRFRGAANSDDVFDFQVFLSPGDVWSGKVYLNDAGETKLLTADASCTKPKKDVLNDQAFSTVRVNKFLTATGRLNETREGYVELFNMADIPPFLTGTTVNPLYTAIKHVKSVAPCTNATTPAAWALLDTKDPLNATEANAMGLFVPTTGLFANWIILNGADAGAWSGRAAAINAVDINDVATTGAITYFAQTDTPFPSATTTRLQQFTADPVLLRNPTMARTYDVPDFSIPYTNTNDPKTQVANLSLAIATKSVINEFLTASAINATTDWVLSMPTRRYSVAYDYKNDTTVYTAITPSFFDSTNTQVIERQICVKDITSTSYDQEENTAGAKDVNVVISPKPEGETGNFLICGEASVLAFNSGESAPANALVTSASGTLKATVARSTVENTYLAGWSSLATPGIGGAGLPILGYEAIRATSAPNTFGATLEHRTDRVVK